MRRAPHTTTAIVLFSLGQVGIIGCGDDVSTEVTMETDAVVTTSGDDGTTGSTGSTGPDGSTGETTGGNDLDTGSTSTGDDTQGDTEGDTEGEVVDDSPAIAIFSPANLAVFVPGWEEMRITIEVTDLDLAEPGGENEPGMGHIEVYLDGDLLDVLTNLNAMGLAETEQFALPSTGGIHRIHAIARHNDGTAYEGTQAQSHGVFWINDGKEHIAIVAPDPHTEVPIGTDLEIEVAMLNWLFKRAHGAPPYAPGEGHLHTFFDTAWGAPGNPHVFPESVTTVADCIEHCRENENCDEELDCNRELQMVFAPHGQILTHVAFTTKDPLVVDEPGEHLYEVLATYNGSGHPIYFRIGTEPEGHVNHALGSTETAEIVHDAIPLLFVPPAEGD
jgi:hypothetical protein